MLVGINLLREGLDLPEVSLVAILDADKEGFLRSERSLIQTIGRAARNVNGRVIMYADTITDSMEAAISETNRRRQLQMEHNRKHGITPETIKKEVTDIVQAVRAAEDEADYRTDPAPAYEDIKDIVGYIKELEKQMFTAANELEFELAAQLRDQIRELRQEAGLVD